MKFKYKYKTYILISFILVYVLGAVCFVWNLYRLIAAANSPIELSVYNYITYSLCLVLPVVFDVFVTAALINSCYEIKDGFLRVRFGLLSDKYRISDIDSLIKNVSLNKLTVIFKDESPMKVIIDESKFDDFSTEILKINKTISYSQVSENSDRNKR